MKYARISSQNSVIEVYSPPAGVAIEDCFTPEIAAQFEPVPEEVQANWIKQADGTFVPPPPEPETEAERARNVDGTFAADDPTTPENEAWAS